MVSHCGIADRASMAQVGTLAGEFERLGYRSRECRLAAAAAVLGIDGLDSFRDLTPEQAGNLFCWVRRGGVNRTVRVVADRDRGREPLRSRSDNAAAQPTATDAVTVLPADADVLVLAAALIAAGCWLAGELRHRWPMLGGQAA